MLVSPNRLKRAGVVGINGRNAGFVMPLNRRALYPLVDDKRKTKELMMEASIAVPELYQVIDSQGQIKDFPDLMGDRTSFVVKPANGSQGDGIIVIDGRVKHGWRKIGGGTVSDDEMAYHLSNTLSGMYSLAGRPDVALAEYRVGFDPVFEQITYRGVPDVRVLVYRGVPALAMLRLPTRQSDGKANLHKGGIGAGVNIATGLTMAGVQSESIVERHPDTDSSIVGLTVPHWPRILEISARSAEITGLGYLGVDIVLDGDLGPLILELNARPGLAIQIANQTGLRKRTDAIDAAFANLGTLEQKLAFVTGTLGTV